MRVLAPICVIAVLGAACAAAPELVITGGGDVAIETPTPVPAVTPSPAPQDLAELLLTADDVPGWQHSGPMEFPAEPTFESEDCDLMNQAWAANRYPGTRTRASTQGVALRNTVVELEDEATAAAVLDAADRVWEECVQLMVDGDDWWVEPVGVPPAGWRASGLVLGGVDDGLTWVIAYWQRDNVIVLLEFNGERTFDYLQPLFATMVGRLEGTPAPVPELPEPGTRPDQTLVPEPKPTAAPSPEPTTGTLVEPPPDVPDQAEDIPWTAHPLAIYVPDPGEIGTGWIINNARITTYAPAAANDDLASCGLVEPPTLEGIEVTYTGELDYENTVEFIVNRGSVADAQSFLDVFRGFANCEPELLGFYGEIIEISNETIDLDGADDAEVIELSAEADGLAFNTSFVVARYGGLLFAMSTGSLGASEPLSTDKMVELIENASRR